MQVIHIGGKPIAVGLHWKTLSDSQSTSSQLKQLSGEHGTKFGYIVRSDDGVQTAGFAVDPRGKAICGAALVAQAAGERSVLVVEPAGPGFVWMCAVASGHPVRGFDIVVPDSQVYDKVQEVSTFGDFDVVASAYPELDDVHIRRMAGDPKFADFVAKVAKPPKIKQIVGIPLIFVVVGLGLAAALVTYIVISGQIKEAKLREAARKAQELAEQNRRAEAERIKKEAEDYIATARKKVADQVLNRPAPQDQMRIWLDTVGDIPGYVSGWKLRTLSCNASVCRADYERTRYGTMNSFAEGAARKQWLVDTLKADDAGVLFPFTATPRDLERAFQLIPDERRYMQELYSTLQRAAVAGVAFQMTLPAKVKGDLPPLPPGQPAPQPPPPPPAEIPWKVGSVRASGSGVFALRDVVDYVKLNALSLDAMQVDFGAKSWTLEIKYVVVD